MAQEGFLNLVSRQVENSATRFDSVPQALECWARIQAECVALRFLGDGEGDAVSLTYGELWHRVQGLAGYLVANGYRDQRVLLLMPSCLEYVVAFVACLLAGTVAVPLYPPRNNWHDKRLADISNDAQACAALTLTTFAGQLVERLRAAGARSMDTLVTVDRGAFEGDGGALAVRLPPVNPSAVAYLQYTSGSTGSPKGVMVRQSDIAWNMQSKAVDLDAQEVAVSWLPIFHDMGLVQGVVMPLVRGGTAVFMPPTAFVQDPLRWLRAVDRFKAVFSGGPNFGYQLCVDAVPADTDLALDLSSWRTALNAAEPISSETVQQFHRTFGPYGLSRDALVGGFGMAEATLYVTAGSGPGGAPVLHLDRHALSMGHIEIRTPESESVVALVSSGLMSTDPLVRIVGTGIGRALEDCQIGEIWVSGSAVCPGYWHNEPATAESFGHVLASDPGQSFLRTGDLGFTHQGHLYVTGRLKDLIIVRGANHYPQDIERDVEKAHPSFRTGRFSAAFTLDDRGSTALVVVQEVKRTQRKRVDVDEIGPMVARLIASQHGIELDQLVLVEPGGVPNTSSGKVQRKACRALLLEGRLPQIAVWTRSRSRPTVRPEPAESIAASRVIENWLIGEVAAFTGLPASHIDVAMSFHAVARSRIRSPDTQTIEADLHLCAPDGAPVLAVDRLRLRLVPTPTVSVPTAQAFEVLWEALDIQVAGSTSPASTLCVGRGPCVTACAAASIEVVNLDLVRELERVLEAIRPRLSQDTVAATGTRLSVFLTGPSAPIASAADPGAHVRHASAWCQALQSLIVALDQRRWTSRVRLVLVSESATGSDAQGDANTLAAAAASGLARSATIEYGELDIRLVDLPSSATAADWQLAWATINGPEPQLRVREGVVTVPRISSRASARDPWRSRFDPAAAYLITGGTGAIGLAFAAWMADAGARHLVLVSRRGQVPPEVSDSVDGLRARGVRVDVLPLDVTDGAAVNTLIGRFGVEWPVLRGLVHAAGIRRDRTLDGLIEDDWIAVAAAKCVGAKVLDMATRGRPLDFFVLCSSVAAPFGSAGQANYAAANAMLESIGESRRACGEPTLIVHWGPWADVGMAADAQAVAHLHRRGLRPMSAGDALRTLAQFPSRSGNVVIWQALQDRFLQAEASAFRRSLWAQGPAVVDAGVSSTGPPLDPSSLAKLDPDDALAALIHELGRLAAEVLRQPIPGQGEVLAATQLSLLGLDSLMAMDLRNRVRQWIGVYLPAHLLISGSSLGDVSKLIYEQALLLAVQHEPTTSDTQEVFVL